MKHQDEQVHCSCFVDSCLNCSWTRPQALMCAPTSVRHAYFSCIEDACHCLHSVWTVTREQQRHSTFFLQELSMHLSILAKHWHVTDAFFAFGVHCQSGTVFDLIFMSLDCTIHVLEFLNVLINMLVPREHQFACIRVRTVQPGCLIN